MSNLLSSERDGRVLRLTLNRPEKRNALSTALCVALADALESADRDPEIGAVCLTGAGPSFCAGMDLSEVLGAPPPGLDDAQERLFTIGSRITTPIVAGVHGAAIAGGTGVVANCHIAIAAPDAEFGLTEINIGLWPFLVYRAVSAIVGERRTLQLALSGARFKSAKAQELGLIHQIADDPAALALDLSRQIAGRNPVAIRNGMAYVHASRTMTSEASGQLARSLRQEVFASPGFQEAMAAFANKRQTEKP